MITTSISDILCVVWAGKPSQYITNQPLRSTQPSITAGSANWALACLAKG